jgi:pyruvate formate lyase activating enzyme
VPTLKDVLDERTHAAAAELCERIDEKRIRCLACGHRCPIPEGAVGVCKVRGVRGGELYAPWGYVGGVQCDPIEKKPFFHAVPGALAFSFGMLGCDLHCSYCQNWVTSQALRDPEAVAPPQPVTPEALVRSALDQGARVVVSTYNEPLITAEWAVAIFEEARAAGLMTAFVSNGNGTPQVLEYIRPHIDLYKVDLKSFNDRRYRELGGRLEPILETIRHLHATGVWVEIVTLLIPGFNDSDEEITRLTEFVASVSPDIPWHVTAFHGDYRMTEPGNTTPGMLRHAALIGQRAGLRYVYAGNLPGRVDTLEDTRCPSCSRVLVARYGYLIKNYDVTADGRCPGCRTPIPGRWDRSFARQQTAFPYLPAMRVAW